MVDYRISVEELESQAEALEMVRKLVRDAMEQVEGFEISEPTPPHLILTEEYKEIVPLLNK